MKALKSLTITVFIITLLIALVTFPTFGAWFFGIACFLIFWGIIHMLMNDDGGDW